MRLLSLPANEYRRERWRNQRGWTREIHRDPEGSADWTWRASIAEVDQDAPFSRFPDCDRELVLVAGEGMDLVFADGERVPLRPPHQRHRFAGERELHAELVSGSTHDFNLIWRRDRVTATMLHRPLVGPMVFFEEPGVSWLAYLLSGQAAFRDLPRPLHLAAGDSVLLQADAEGPSRLILSGAGELLLARLAQVGDAPA
ncbi:HutD/Ves family protein [Arenimonas fontis]|uniref:HutD family protein n=1 Tax=Arenimonas fontis TaxID=2608255 RepID=A0A5B2Z931_9GAMM|nr:HutD family protein [Arenimonas fontis]KAA2285228.1 HutD family protein [Arenimonas fontis]